MAVPPQLLIMLAQEAKKKRKEVWQKTDSILRNTVAPAVSTTAGMINMYNDQSEDPNVGTGMWSGALQQGALGYQSGGLRGLVGGGVLGGITSGLTTLNRAEQKSISDENADLNKMYGSMVGDDLDLQMLLHGKTGGEVTSSNPENQTEFVPIQAEARMVKTKGRNGKIINKLVKEKLAFADGKISDVNAKKSHSEMPKDFVTDVVKAGTYVFPVFTKLNKKDLNSLVSYGQGNYEENGDNFEISEIRLKDILGEDFQGSFAEAAAIVDKKYPLSDVTDRSDRISVATNNDNARNRMLYINHLIRLNEAKMSGEPVEDMTISPEKKVRAGGYIRNMKTGGVVGDPPRKKKSSWRDYSVKVSSASTQDSMNLYTNARAVDKYYGDKKYELKEEEINSATDPRHTMHQIDLDNREYYEKKDYSPETAPGGRGIYGIGFRTGENFLRNSTSRTPYGMMFVEDYRVPIDENKFKQREKQNNILDTRSPHQLFDRRVNPTRHRLYKNIDSRDILGGDIVEAYMYDPAIVAPESMIHKLSPVELKRRQEYQKSNGMKVSILKPKDRGKLSVNPLPTEIAEIPINAPDVNMKLTGRIKPGGLAEGEFKREWKGVPNLDIIYTKKDGQSIPTYIQNKSGERIPYSEKPTKEFQYPEHFKAGGFVGGPPKKKPYSVSWNNPSSGAAEVSPVAKSEYATRESRETYKDNNKKQADINERANAILKTKKPGEYSGEDIQLINSSTLKNKDIVVGDDNIAKSNAAQEKGDSWTAEGFKNSTQAVGDKLSLRRLPGVGEYIPGFFDVTKGIGDMAAGLGEIPYDVQQGDYGAAAGKVALPLAVGAIGGIGANSTAQFVNNMVNPFAGIVPWKSGKNRIRVNKRFDIYRDELPELMGKHKNEFEQKYGTDYDEKDLGLFAKLKEIEKRKLLKVEELDVVKEKADEFVKKHDPDYKFDKKGEVVIDAYTHGYDSKINKRDGVSGNSKFYDDVVIPELENIIMKNKLKDVQRFYRGTDDHIAQVERNGKTISIPFHQLQKGDIYIPKSFTSTSISDRVAQTFGNHFVEIDAPKGQSYLFAGKAPSNSLQVELESILPKDLRFIVDDISSDDLQKINDMSEMKEGHLYSTGHMKKDGNYYFKGELLDQEGIDFLKDKLPAQINKNIGTKGFKFSIENPYAMIPLYMAMNKLMKEKEKGKVNVYDTNPE